MAHSATSDERVIWIDGELVPWERATVHLLSHSLQRGSLVFDYMSVHDTPRGVCVFRLPEHVDRFLQSCALIGLPIAMGREAVIEAIRETVRANPGATSAKVNAYFASLEVDVVPANPHVTVAVAAYRTQDLLARLPVKPPPPPAQLRIWIEKERRNRRPDIVPPHAKVSSNYVSSMIAKWRAREAGYDEILFLDAEGMLAEGPTINVFLVDGEGVLRTPPEERVLLGVTRATILELARHLGVEVREAPIHPDALFEASEVFVTGTSAGVWPVASIDGRPVGAGKPGPVSERLGELFVRVTAGEAPEFAHWLTPAT